MDDRVKVPDRSTLPNNLRDEIAERGNFNEEKKNQKRGM